MSTDAYRSAEREARAALKKGLLDRLTSLPPEQRAAALDKLKAKIEATFSDERGDAPGPSTEIP